MPKIKVYIKDPDVLYDGITEAIDKELAESGLDEDEQEAIRDIRREKYNDIASEWFEYGEYITVELDTDTKTIRVVPVDEKA